MTRLGIRHLRLLALATGMLAWPAPAHAITIPVGCAGNASDETTLKGALSAANSLTGPDTVELTADCTYPITTVENYWYGPNGLPPVAGPLTIEGHGATIARPAATFLRFRLFFVGADPADPDTLGYKTPGAGSLTLRDVTLSGGLAKGGDGSAARAGGGAGMGGAIFNQGTLVLDRVTMTANTAQGGAVSGPDGTFGAGGGIGESGGGGPGGGFGFLFPDICSCQGGFNGAGGAGGGAGFTGESGGSATALNAGRGGGTPSGLGGVGSGGALGGDGSGGGGLNHNRTASLTEDGGRFGFGGEGGGGGGGVGGGGGQGIGSDLTHYVNGGGGGFGGGGGASRDVGGAGGFGGGGAAGGTGNGAAGFGGGSPDWTQGHGGGGAGMGGAIFNMQGDVTIHSSTLAANTAVGGADEVTDHGKGIAGALFNLNGAVTVTGSTIAANTAAYFASQIFNIGYDAAKARTASLSLANTIVAGGVGAPFDLTTDRSTYINPTPNLSTTSVDLSRSDVVRTTSVFEAGTPAIAGTPLTSDPLLGELKLNGGAVATMAPQPGSPALGAGTAQGLTVDQRGLPRPAAGGDIGAVEIQAPAIAIASPLDGSGIVQGTPLTAAFTCSADPAATISLCAADPPAPALDTTTLGAHALSVSAKDSYGQAASRAAGYSVLAKGSSSASSAPVIGAMKQSHTAWRLRARKQARPKRPVGTSFSFTLDQAATVTLSFAQRVTGRKVGKSCVKATTKNRGKRACTRTVAAGALTAGAHAGKNAVAFKGRISKRKTLKPGRYVVTATAIGPTGLRSASRTLAFTIAR